MVQAQVHQALAAQANRQRERTQHAPRPARVRMVVRTSGVGETRLIGRQRVEFGALMLEEPSFSWGVEAAQPLKAGELPMCTAIVIGYVVNQNGFYTAAEMGFRVDSENLNVRLKFSLTFEAAAMRSTLAAGTSGNADAVVTNGSTVFRG